MSSPLKVAVDIQFLPSILAMEAMLPAPKAAAGATAQARNRRRAKRSIVPASSRLHLIVQACVPTTLSKQILRDGR